MYRVSRTAEATRRRVWRAPVNGPHRPAIQVDGYAVGAAPRSLLQGKLRPIPDNTIGICSAVDGLDVLRLHGASLLLRLDVDSRQRNTANDGQWKHPEPLPPVQVHGHVLFLRAAALLGSVATAGPTSLLLFVQPRLAAFVAWMTLCETPAVRDPSPYIVTGLFGSVATAGPTSLL